MADVYQFSECSLELLERCIAAGKQPGKKWMELFKPEVTENNSFNDDEDTIVLSVKSPNEYAEDIEPSEEIQPPTDEITVQNLKLEKVQAVEKIGAKLEKTPSNKLKCLKHCLIEFSNYEPLLPDLAENLSIHYIEKICEEILELESDKQTENIVLHFFPALIQRTPSHNSLNLLIRGYKIYSETILAVIQSVFVNIDVPDKLIGEFFKAVEGKARSEFLQSISSIQLPPEIFHCRLNTLSSLYTASEKSFEINNFIVNGLLQTAQLCQQDKNYGKFLLAFFQSLNCTNNQISRQSLVVLLDSHKTPFKRLCQNILDKIDKT